MDELSFDFPFINRSDRIDIINIADNYIENTSVFHGKFASIKDKEIDYMLKREMFLSLPTSKAVDEALRDVFKNATQTEVDDALSERELDQEKFRKTYNSLCERCADKDICLEIFRSFK